tara:strand:+ start:76 stop:894 length:819 start_codon:yes stop_codon:yes gene_type:complete
MEQSNMLSYKSLPTINKVIDIITKKEKGAYLRFGDGDLNIMQGMNELLNSYNEKFSNELKESITIDNENYLKGVCLMCNKFKLLEEKMWPGNHEWPENIATNYYKLLSIIRKKPLLTYYTFVAFNYYLTTYPEKSYPLMKNIRDLCLKNDVIFIGNNTVNKNVINLLFGEKYTFIECPSKYSYNNIDNIENNLIAALNNNINYKIVVTCCGVTTRCLIKRIWKKQNINCNYFMLDFGSIIDALSGNKTRQYIIETKFNGKMYCERFKKYIDN